MRVASDWPVWITLLVALTLGFTFQKNARQQTNRIEWEQTRFQIPTDWTIVHQDSNRITAADRRGHGPFGPRISLYRMDTRTLLPQGGGLWQASVNWSSQQSQAYTGYRVIRMTPVMVQGKEGIKMECAYLQEVGANSKPGLMLSTEIVVQDQDHFYIWAFAAEEKLFGQSTDLEHRLLGTWHLQEKKK